MCYINYSQWNIWLGPFNSSIPDPWAISQEKRAVKTEFKIGSSLAGPSAAMKLAATHVNDYAVSLTNVASSASASGPIQSFLTACSTYINAKFWTSGISLPPLKIFSIKNGIALSLKQKKLTEINKDFLDIVNPLNPMTETERKSLQLINIRRALKICLE